MKNGTRSIGRQAIGCRKCHVKLQNKHDWRSAVFPIMEISEAERLKDGAGIKKHYAFMTVSANVTALMNCGYSSGAAVLHAPAGAPWWFPAIVLSSKKSPVPPLLPAGCRFPSPLHRRCRIVFRCIGEEYETPQQFLRDVPIFRMVGPYFGEKHRTTTFAEKERIKRSEVNDHRFAHRSRCRRIFS